MWARKETWIERQLFQRRQRQQVNTYTYPFPANVFLFVPLLNLPQCIFGGRRPSSVRLSRAPVQDVLFPYVCICANNDLIKWIKYLPDVTDLY